MQQGVTATNLNMNIMQWFSDNIFGDLQVCCGWWRPPGIAGRCNQVPLHVPLSGAPCFFNARSLFESLSPATAHEGTTGLGAAAATESPRVAGSPGIHICYRGARSDPIYAYRRFDDAYVRLPSHRLVLVINFCRFSSTATVRAAASQRHPREDWSPEQPGAHGRERLSHALCVCLSIPACWCLISCLSQVL